MLLIIFFSALQQKSISAMDKVFYFLGLLCLATYYALWFFGQASPFYFQLDLPLLFNLMLLIGTFLIFRGLRILFK